MQIVCFRKSIECQLLEILLLTRTKKRDAFYFGKTVWTPIELSPHDSKFNSGMINILDDLQKEGRVHSKVVGGNSISSILEEVRKN